MTTEYNRVQKLILNEEIKITEYIQLRGSYLMTKVTFNNGDSFLIDPIYNQTVNKNMTSNKSKSEKFIWLRKYLIKYVDKFKYSRMS